MVVSPLSSSWGLYQGMLDALASSQSVSMFFFAGAASALERRVGFETAAGFLRVADWSRSEALRRSVVGFLERRDVAAALMPHVRGLAPFAGVPQELLPPEAPRDAVTAPWWFEAKHPLKNGGGMVPIEAGALAVGDERALDWLLKVRDLTETGGSPEGFSASPHLIWIPETSSQATQLNKYGRVYRREASRVEPVNEPGRIPIRALFPYPLRLGREQQTARMAFRTFQHQFWTETPESLQARLGADLLARLPEKVLVHQQHFLHPQAIMLPDFGAALAPKHAARIVFQQAGRVWLGRPTGAGVQDRTSETSPELMSYFRRLAGLEAVRPRTLTGQGVPEELPEDGPGRNVERIVAPTNEEGKAALDPTQPLKAEVIDALVSQMGLPYDATSPLGVPALTEESPTKPARGGLLRLLGRVFTRRNNR